MNSVGTRLAGAGVLTRCQAHEKRDESACASSGAPAWRMPQLHSHEVGGDKVHKQRELSVSSPCMPRLAAASLLQLPAAACKKHPFKKLLAQSCTGALGNHAAGTPRRRQPFCWQVGVALPAPIRCRRIPSKGVGLQLVLASRAASVRTPPQARGVLRTQPVDDSISESRATPWRAMTAAGACAVCQKPSDGRVPSPPRSQARVASAPGPTMPRSNSGQSCANSVLMMFFAKYGPTPRTSARAAAAQLACILGWGGLTAIARATGTKAFWPTTSMRHRCTVAKDRLLVPQTQQGGNAC